MRIDKNMTNEELMNREFVSYENALWRVKKVIGDYYSGKIGDPLDVVDVLEKQLPKIKESATLYRIAELACELEAE